MNASHRRPDRRPAPRARRPICLAALGSLCLTVVGASSSSAAPTLYHSPNGVGTDRTPWPQVLQAPGPIVVNLFIDEDDGVTNPSQNGEVVCRDGSGEERCGWDVEIEVESSDDSITIASFAPSVGGTLVNDETFTLRFNGGTPTTGEASHTQLGVLTLNAPANADGQVIVRKLHVVDASMGLTKPVEPPGEVIAFVPEPRGVPALALGGLLVVGLHRRRAARHRSP